MSRRESLRIVTALFVLVIVPLGCSEADPFPELHPLKGTVTRNGTPVSGGGLIFIPDSPARPGLIVNAPVGKDGTFTAQTEHTGRQGLATRPGVPAGRYKAVYHPPSDGSKTGLESEVEQPVIVEAKENTVVIILPAEAPKGNGASRDDAPKKDTPKKEAPKTDAPKQEAPKNGAGK